MTPSALREFRRQRGLTQAEAAARLGYGARQWQKFEAGAAEIPPALSLAVGYVTLTGQWRFPPAFPPAAE